MLLKFLTFFLSEVMSNTFNRLNFLMLKYTECKEKTLLNLSPANSLPTLNNPAKTVMFKRSTTLTVSTEHKQSRLVVWIFTCGFTKRLSNNIQGHAGKKNPT